MDLEAGDTITLTLPGFAGSSGRYLCAASDFMGLIVADGVPNCTVSSAAWSLETLTVRLAGQIAANTPFSFQLLHGNTTGEPRSLTRNLKPGTRNSEPGTRSPKPGTRNQKKRDPKPSYPKCISRNQGGRSCRRTGWRPTKRRSSSRQTPSGARSRTPPCCRRSRYSRHPAPYTQHPTPITLHPTPYTQNPKPETLNP
jgi:hypothetical protein